MPHCKDELFQRTVIYLWQHNEDGVLGFILNRPNDIPLAMLLERLNLKLHDPYFKEHMVLSGGNSEPEKGFVVHYSQLTQGHELHEPFPQWRSTKVINDVVSITTSTDILEAICEGNGPKESFVCLGYMVWSAGQLESELALNDGWFLTPADHTVLFHTPTHQKYEAALALLGIEHTINDVYWESGHA